MKNAAGIIFPDQLFHDHPVLLQVDTIFIVEHPLYFLQHNFHKQKLIFHRASMKAFAKNISKSKKTIIYVDAKDASDENIALMLKKHSIKTLLLCQTHDDSLEHSLKSIQIKTGIKLEYNPSPSFLFTKEHYAHTVTESESKKLLMASFYIKQRKQLQLLTDKSGKPIGGKWSFDTENRKRIPPSLIIPELQKPKKNKWVPEAVAYVEKNFPQNYGEKKWFGYPITHEEAEAWLEDFLSHRLKNFGPYQDAIVKNNGVVFHSLLSPLINAGLLTPEKIVNRTLDFGAHHKIDLSSLEGFLRQIIGWREFIMMAYCKKNQTMRRSNFWGCSRKMPQAFWEGKTGIEPVDTAIKNLNATAYNHHIERLMVLGSFMLLCEIKPNDVYTWFMSMYIDAYDWVMVPNVYGMSQYADGGSITTKPYICSSNYIIKMSNYKKGNWCSIWDGLYWRFINKHQKIFMKNQRMSMMVFQLQRMDQEKLNRLIESADNFLGNLN